VEDLVLAKLRPVEDLVLAKLRPVEDLVLLLTLAHPSASESRVVMEVHRLTSMSH
jgi:hypothetical protein